MAENEQGTEIESPEEQSLGLLDLDNADDPDITYVEGGEIVGSEEEDDDEAEEVSDDEAEEQDEDEEEVEEEESGEEDEAASGTEGEDTAEETEDSAEAPTEVVSEEATETPAEKAPAPVEREPLAFKADGREFTVPGRKDDAGNLIIAPEDWQRHVQPRLADRGAWQQERESLQRQVAALDPNSNPEVIRAREVMKSFHGLLEQGPDAVIEWAEDFERNKDLLMARAEVAAAKAEADRYRGEKTEATRAQEMETIDQQLETGLDNLLERAAQDERFAGLDMTHVKRVLAPMRNSIFFRAEQDMPEAGLSKGEIGVNLKVVTSVLQAEAERDNAYKSQLEAAKAAREAKKRNDAALGKTNKAPPVENSKSVHGQGKPEIKPAKNAEEWERNLMALTRG